MGIYRSTNPLEWDDVDGIIVNESAPAPNVAGVAANIVILVAQAERGPTALTDVSSIGELHELYGKSNFGLNKALKNKKMGFLRVIRAVADDAAEASKTFTDGGGTPVDIIEFTAKQGVGAYGNNIQVKIEAGSTTGKKYTIKDTTSGSVMLQETYDNVTIATVVSAAVFANSNLVTATVLSTASEPANAAFTALATGSDGTIADADYQTALELASVEKAGNVLILDEYNSTRNGYLKAHVAANPDKMVICCGPEAQTVAEAITDVANVRDTEGRIIYAFPWIETKIDGVLVYTAPASWYASILSQTSPHIDPAFKKNTQFLAGVVGLKLAITRAQYISMKDAGISAFEYDSDIGFAIKSGIVTQIADSSKVTVLRRRMADFLTNSAALYLKNYQNAVNSKQNRTFIKGGMLGFITGLENDGILPKDSDVKEGYAKLVDVESANTDVTIAQGYMKIVWKQRIFSSMRYLVLSAEIGESVVVTEAA